MKIGFSGRTPEVSWRRTSFGMLNRLGTGQRIQGERRRHLDLS
jgi:hypothetical protein